MKARRILVLVGAILSALVLFLAMQFALQRVDATVNNGSGPLDSPLAPPGNLVSPLNSPLQTPEPSPDINDDPVDIESLTHTVYLPFISTRPNKFGTEVDSAFTNTNGADKIIQAGFGWYRHMQVDWASHEVTPGQYITTPSEWDRRLDDGVAYASANGLQPIIVIRDSPAWATVGGIAGCDSVKPSAYISLANFVNWVVARYKQPPYNAKYYELWNEPDLGVDRATTEIGCWRSGVDYASMLQAVYPIVKAQNPDISILNGGLAFLDQWAQDFIITGTNYIDILTYHAYDAVSSNDALWRYATGERPAAYLKSLDTLRNWLVVSNTSRSDMDIFMDEGALAYAVPTPTVQHRQRSQSYFAAFMAANVVGEDLGQYSWFRSWTYDPFHSEYGEITGSQYVTNIVYTALSFAMHSVDQATPITTTRSQTGASIIKLTDASGEDLWLMWNTNTVSSTAFTYQFAYTSTAVWDVWGAEVPVTTSLVMTDPYKVVWVKP